MQKLVSLCRNSDFRRAYSKAKSYVSPVVVVYVMRNRHRQLRYGITTSKKVGNAVQRNRSRRIIREAYRSIVDRLRPGYDLVFVARGRTPYVKSTDVLKSLEKLLATAGILKQETPQKTHSGVPDNIGQKPNS